MRTPYLPRLVEALPAVRNSKRGTVLTAVMLTTNDHEVWRACLHSVDQGRIRIDEELISSLYSSGDRKTKLALASSTPASRMRPRAFRKLFDEMYALPDLTVGERLDLAHNLYGFLYRNPRYGPVYADIIRDMVTSSHFDTRVNGIQMAARFTHVDTELLDVCRHRMKSTHPITRLSAVAAFQLMMNRWGDLDPEIRAFLATDAFRDTVSRMRRSDPDHDVRWGSRNLHRKLRDATGPAKRRSPSSRRRA